MGEPVKLGSDQKTTTESAESIDLIYKITGEPSEIDVFELSRVLDAFGHVLKETYRVTYPIDGELNVTVKPFQQGSFLMDMALSVQQNPGLFLLTQPEMISRAKQVLEYLGFINKVKETGASLLELLRGLKNGKPASVEQTGPDSLKYYAIDGAVMPVNSTVNALYNNSIINNYTFNIVAPVERDSVERISTYLKSEPEKSAVNISKEDASAVRAFAVPPELEVKIEVLEGTTTKILKPKSGNYGQTTGVWIFTIAGTKSVIKAHISDKDFLTKYSSGSIRFYQDDRLKVKLLERQVVEGGKTRMEYEIVQVLDYTQAHPAVRPVQVSIPN